MPQVTHSDPNLRQRRAVFNLYLIVAYAYAIFFAPVYLFYYHYLWLGWLHVLFIPSLMWISWDIRHHDFARGEHVLRGLCAVMMAALALSGGAEGTGLAFAQAGIVFIFFLGNRTLGFAWNMAVYLLLVGAVILNFAGLVALPYSKLFAAGFTMSWGLIFLFLYLYSGQKDKADHAVATQLVQLRELLARSEELQHELTKEKASVEHKITERTRELSETKAELTASVSSLPFGFALINKRGEIVFSNTALANLLDRPIPTDPAATREALSQIAYDFREAVDLPGCIHQVFTKNRTIERNIELAPRFYHLILTPVTTGNTTIGTVLFLQDTTDERAMERSRDEFFSIASHELRTPLTAVRGNAQMMLRYYAQNFQDPKLHEMVEDVHDASVRLIEIVNDFLDMSRLEQGKISFKASNFDPVSLCKSILRTYEVTGSRRKLKLELDSVTHNLPLVHADPDRTRQIIINLVGNAIKFTDKGGVTIHLTTDKQVVKIAVSDTGKGMPLASHHLLFRKFQQASNNALTRDSTRGTGLGLYISQLMATGMHGKLYLESSEVGHGSTFTLELPVAK
jgi:signal transduction histidine kinase